LREGRLERARLQVTFGGSSEPLAASFLAAILAFGTNKLEQPSMRLTDLRQLGAILNAAHFGSVSGA
jgi:hypothetical protein